MLTNINVIPSIAVLGFLIYAIDWTRNNSFIVTVNENSLVYAHNVGLAEITAKVIGSESVSSICTIGVEKYSLSTNFINTEVPTSDDILVYPNLVSNGNVGINFRKKENNVIIEVYNSLGQREKTTVLKNIDKYVLDVSGLNDGVYFLKLYFSNKEVNKKIIITE